MSARARTVIAAIFLLLAADAWRQVIQDGVLQQNEPRLLTALKIVAGAAALAACWGGWRRTRWAPIAAVVWGVTIAVLLIATEPVLGLGAEGRAGRVAGSAAVLVASVGLAMVLRVTDLRSTR